MSRFWSPLRVRPPNEVSCDPLCGRGDVRLQANQAGAGYIQGRSCDRGEIHGKVRFAGKKPPAKPISMDAEEACEKLHDKPVDGSGFAVGKDDGLANVFVYIKSGLEGKPLSRRKKQSYSISAAVCLSRE